MSWKEKIETELIVTTGDKKQFKPQWQNATKSYDFNISQFDFVNVRGSLIKRQEPKAREFPIEWYFQGEENVDVADDFEESSKDKRSWVVNFPYYGRVVCHPIKLTFDNSVHNITRITGVLFETIEEDNPKTSVNPVDKIIADKSTTDETFAESFANDVVPSVSDKNSLTANTAAFYNEGAKSVKNTVDAETYFNLFNTANAAILDATDEPLAAIRAVQAVITAPYLFVDNIKGRLTTIVNQWERLRLTIDTITTKSGKKIYESNGSALISTMAATSATPQSESDYGNKTNVLATINPILLAYNQYLADLDLLQSPNGGNPDNYIPDADSLIALNHLVNYTIANLYIIALGAKQERSIIVEDNTNIIILAHRFYGLKADDSTISTLILQNGIGLNKLLQIKKGETIIYYI